MTLWDIPDGCFEKIQSAVEFLGVSRPEKVVSCHVDSKPPSPSAPGHVCTSGGCSVFYPFQTCGTVCGVVVMIVSLIAVYDFKEFEKLRSTKKGHCQFSYLKEVSKYNDFLRVCLIRWIFSHGDIMEDLKPRQPHCATSGNQNLSLKDEETFSRTEPKQESVLPKIPDLEKEKSFVNYKTEKVNLTEKNAEKFEFNISLSQFENFSSENLISKCNTSCSIQYQHFHCLLCDNNCVFPTATRFKRHAHQVHLSPKHFVKYNDSLVCLPCKKIDHVPHTSDRMNHFHCPYCSSVFKQKCHFRTHLDSHTGYVDKIPNVQAHVKVSVIKSRNISGIALNQPRKQIQCDQCGLLLRTSSLKRHIQSKHPENTAPTSICVDKKQAIFMVMKNCSGTPYPIHVQKILHDMILNLRYFESDDCQMLFGVSSLSKKKGNYYVNI